MSQVQSQAKAWADLRRLGWSARKIAAVEQVPVGRVIAQTAPFGPFRVAPRPGAAAQYRRWAAQRRAGQTIASIAAQAGVSRQWIEQVTRGLGPYPRQHQDVDEQLRQAWAQRRRDGWSVAAIAQAEGGIPRTLVARSTRDLGPFPAHRAVPGSWNRADIARFCGVGRQVVDLWARSGALPVAKTDRHGREVWRPVVIEAWANRKLTRCPVCGARVRSVAIHTGRRHRDPETTRATL